MTDKKIPSGDSFILPIIFTLKKLSAKLILAFLSFGVLLICAHAIFINSSLIIKT